MLGEEREPEGARLLAERVRHEFSAHVFQAEKGKVQVTCSLGVATFPLHAQNQNALFESADKALYSAKHKGRNQVVLAQMAK